MTSNIKVKVIKGKTKVIININNNVTKSKQLKDKFIKIDGVELY